MKYREFRDFVMQLLNQYSIRGTPVDGMYNDQSDYFSRIPSLYNSAMVDIAENGQAFIGVMHPEESEITAWGKDYSLVPIPDDYMSMTEDGLPMEVGGRITRIKAYYPVGDKIAIRNDLLNNAILEYNRFPKQLAIGYVDDFGAEIDDTALDGTLEQQYAAGYFVASMLVLGDDSFQYSALRNEYDDRLSNMKHRLRAERYYIDDAMGTDSLYLSGLE